jgi:hypothetical protein
VKIGEPFLSVGAGAFHTSEPDVVLKYGTNCDSLEGIHPLVRELAIYEIIKDLEITLQILYLSDPVKLKFPVMGSKTDFLLPHQQSVAECFAHELSSVRVMAIESPGDGFRASDLVPDNLSSSSELLHQALRRTVEILRLVEKLHSAGIVHGAAYVFNVKESKSGGLRLVNFKKSFFASDFTGEPEISGRSAPKGLINSPWELRGFRPGFRDDLFHAMQCLALLLMGVPFIDHLESLSADQMYSFKMEGNFFSIAPLNYNPITAATGLCEQTKRSIQELVDEAMAVTRNQPQVDLPAPTGRIVELLESCVTLIEGEKMQEEIARSRRHERIKELASKENLFHLLQLIQIIRNIQTSKKAHLKRIDTEKNLARLVLGHLTNPRQLAQVVETLLEVASDQNENSLVPNLKQLIEAMPDLRSLSRVEKTIVDLQLVLLRPMQQQDEVGGSWREDVLLHVDQLPPALLQLILRLLRSRH